MSRFRRYGIPSLVFLVIVLAIFWRLWTPIKGAQKNFAWDSQWEYWGDLQFQLDSYRDGELPLWNPYDRGGYPFNSDPQAGVLYPLTWVLLAIGRVFGARAWLADLKGIMHLWLAGVGLYAYLRWRGLPKAASYAGGILFLLSSPFIRHASLALTWSMAWAPWALLAVEAWAEKPVAWRAALLALALAMSFLAGAAPTFWYTLVIIVPMAIWAIAHHARAAEKIRPYLIRIGATGTLALLLFVALCAAQLVATAALVPHTVRSDPSFDFFMNTRFGVADVVSFVVPRLTILNNYVGLAAVLWIAAAVSLRPDPRSFVLVSLAVAGVLFSWGPYTDTLAIGASLASPFRMFRYAFRYIYVTQLPLAILAAEGLAALSALDDAARRRRIFFILLGVGAVAVTIFGVGFVANLKERDAYGQGFVIAILAVWVTALVIAHGRAKPLVLAAACALAAIDLYVAHVDMIEKNTLMPSLTLNDRDLAKLEHPGNDARIFDRKYLKFRPGLRLHLRDLGGYKDDPLALSRYARLRDAVEAAPGKLGHANVRYLLEEAPLTPKSGADMQELKQLWPNVFEVQHVAPEVLWVVRPTVVDDEEHALPALLATTPGTAAVLEGVTAAGSSEDAPPVAGRVTSYRRNSLTAEIDAPASGVVVIHEAYYPGWTATVDGEPATILPANVMFRAVVVGPGHHVIAMHYHDTRYLALALVELFALAATGAIVWRGRRA